MAAPGDRLTSQLPERATIQGAVTAILWDDSLVDVSALISQHYDYAFARVYRFTRNVEAAEDIMQEAVIKVLRLGGPDDPSKFKQWFAVVAINCAKNEYRKRDHQRNRVDLDLDKVEAGERIVADTVEYVSREIMRKFVESLPPRQQMAFRMRIHDDMAFVDIAEIMNCCYDTAKANYQQAVQKLRRLLCP